MQSWHTHPQHIIRGSFYASELVTLCFLVVRPILVISQEHKHNHSLGPKLISCNSSLNLSHVSDGVAATEWSALLLWWMCPTCWDHLKGNIDTNINHKKHLKNFSFFTVNFHHSVLFDAKCHTIHQRNRLENNLRRLWTLLAHEKEISVPFLIQACEFSFILSLNWINPFARPTKFVLKRSRISDWTDETLPPHRTTGPATKQTLRLSPRRNQKTVFCCEGFVRFIAFMVQMLVTDMSELRFYPDRLSERFSGVKTPVNSQYSQHFLYIMFLSSS